MSCFRKGSKFILTKLSVLSMSEHEAKTKQKDTRAIILNLFISILFKRLYFQIFQFIITADFLTMNNIRQWIRAQRNNLKQIANTLKEVIIKVRVRVSPARYLSNLYNKNWPSPKNYLGDITISTWVKKHTRAVSLTGLKLQSIFIRNPGIIGNYRELSGIIGNN